KVGTNPIPQPAATTNARTASDGTARPRFATAVAATWPRWRWPTATPIGIAITAATATAANETQRGPTSRSRIPIAPDQLPPVVGADWLAPGGGRVKGSEGCFIGVPARGSAPARARPG